jgi:Ferritin-like domain
MNEKSMNRRQLFRGAALLGAGALTSSLGMAQTTNAATKPDIDVDVLNFALNLEYLEAEFYLAAVGRKPSYEVSGVMGAVNTASSAAAGSVTGGQAVKFSNTAFGRAVREYAEEIATDEENHVKFLRAALGDKAVARPAIDIGPAFAVAAAAASKNAIKGFSPYGNELFFLHGAFIFEDVGVTAYKGAAPLITNPAYLEAAAGILGVEAYHAGIVRTLLYQNRSTVAAAGLKVEQIVAAISDLRDAVDGTDDRDQGITMGGKANLVPTDNNSIAFSRTTEQVLNIVYLGNKGKGGFFPNGLNGNIK